MHNGLTWAIARVVVDILNPIVEQCVLNQTRGYWLFSNVFNATITICMKLKVDENDQGV